MKLLPLQGYMRGAMGSSGFVRALIGTRIFDSVPPNPPESLFPYIAFGTSDGHDYSVGCWEAWEVFQIVNVYSRPPGYPECKRIMDAVCQALDTRTPLIPTVRCALFTLNNTRTLRLPDGVTSEGVVEFRSIYGPL